MNKQHYKKSIDLIVKINELVVEGAPEKDADPYYDELAEARKKLTPEQSQVIERLTRSLSLPVIVEIDEATPGSKAHWNN